MEANYRWALVTAIAPIAWGATYVVTGKLLPADLPLTGATLRALPAGLVLLLVRRDLPRGVWWWRSLVLGALNMSAFFVFVYLAAHLLPSGVAATVMATSPLVMMLFGWALLRERPTTRRLAAGAIGVGGVALMLLTATQAINAAGVLVSVTAMVSSSLGYVLATRWSGTVHVISSTAWQLIAGGVLLLPVAFLVEGRLPAADLATMLSFAYLAIVATAIAFGAWFAGMQRLGAGPVGLIGLLNPVTGVVLGGITAGESITLRQAAGLGLVLLAVALGRPTTNTGAVTPVMTGLGNYRQPNAQTNNAGQSVRQQPI
jgi:probable blue pigment (indigoidine) exporter